MAIVGAEPDAAFNSPDDLLKRLQQMTDLIEQRTGDLELEAKSRRAAMMGQSHQLIAEVTNLIALSRASFSTENVDTEEEFTSKRLRCLDSMRRIGALSEVSRDNLRGGSYQALRALMRTLIDGLYVELARPTNGTSWEAAILSAERANVSFAAELEREAREDNAKRQEQTGKSD